VGPVTSDAASVFLRVDPQRFTVRDGVAAGRLFVLNASGESLRVDLGALPDDVTSEQSTDRAGPGLTIVEVTVGLGRGFSFGGPFLASPILIDDAVFR
jgi:hypothetical protein